MSDTEDVLEELRKRIGKRTQKEIAAEVSCSQAFLTDVLKRRREPTGKLLEWLGFERKVIYVRIKR